MDKFKNDERDISTLISPNNQQNVKTIAIDSLAYKGYGVGRVDSKVVFVDYACPGDILKIEFYDEHKNYSFGKIVEIITPAPIRIEPVCKHFGICGGCNYLNIPYDVELRWKSDIFKKEFNRVFKGTHDLNDLNISDLADSFKNGSELNYRQKIGLKVSNRKIGFYKKLSHDVVDIDYCYLAKKEVNELLKSVRGVLLSGDYEDTALKLHELSEIILTDTGAKNITFSLKKYINGNARDYSLIFKDIIKKTGADNIFVGFEDNNNDNVGKNGKIKKNSSKIIKYSKNGYKNDNNLQEDCFLLKDKKFVYDLPSFMQVNKEQNENIINMITGYIKNINRDGGTGGGGGGGRFNNALDLFCGSGNITFFLADYAKMVTGVEENPLSVRLGEKNKKLNDINNVDFIMSSVGDFLGKAKSERLNYDMVVLDPPRAGIKGLAAELAGLNPLYIIYVSCDSMTLLRDLKELADSGYIIDHAGLIDMFPRTYHIEHVIFLKRNIDIALYS